MTVRHHTLTHAMPVPSPLLSSLMNSTPKPMWEQNQTARRRRRLLMASNPHYLHAVVLPWRHVPPPSAHFRLLSSSRSSAHSIIALGLKLNSPKKLVIPRRLAFATPVQYVCHGSQVAVHIIC